MAELMSLMTMLFLGMTLLALSITDTSLAAPLNGTGVCDAPPAAAGAGASPFHRLHRCTYSSVRW